MKQKRPSDRYITFKGDRIHSGRLKALFESAVVRGIGISAAGTYLVSQIFNLNSTSPLTNLFASASPSLTSYLIFKFMIEHEAINSFPKTTAETKAIDTTPDENTPPSTDRYSFSAQRAKISAATNLALFAGVNFFVHYILLPKTAPSPNLHLQFWQNFVPIAAGAYSIINRFSKVKKGEWIVVDMPTPERIAEMEEALDRARQVGELVPVPLRG